MSTVMTSQKICQENQRFFDTGGVSRNNRSAGFVPVFRDVETGRMELSRFVGGMPAPIHFLDALPDEWVVSRSASGAVLAVKASVVAGFLRDGRFYNRDEVARAARSDGGSDGNVLGKRDGTSRPRFRAR